MSKNKTLGATLMVAGTTAGAGMLAMPLSVASLGFGVTILLLLVIWLYVTTTALLFVYLHKQFPPGATLISITEHYFGKIGRNLISTILFIFLYLILCAYSTGGSSLISLILPEHLIYKEQIATIIFTIFLGSFVIAGTNCVISTNKLIFILKYSLFFVMICVFIPNIQLNNLLSMPIGTKLHIISAIPVLFTAFGFHVIIPSLYEYLDGDSNKLKLSIWIGTFIPLVLYCLWQLSIQGVLDHHAFFEVTQKNPNLDGLVIATQKITGSHILETVIFAFSSIALLNSFLGISLAIFDSLRDMLRKIKIHSSRIIIGILTYLPVLIISLSYPEKFLELLAYAGMMFTFLGAILPIVLAFISFKRNNALTMFKYFGLFVMLVLSLLIIMIPILTSYGYLPKVLS